MRFLLAILLTATVSFLNAQTATYNKFQWQPTATIHKIDKEFEAAAAVYVVDERINEYINEKDGFFIYRTTHRIIHINNDQGIESFNRIYLPFDEGIEMVDVKARTVLPSGKVIEMDKSNIKDLKEENGQYKIFALEGLTKGCEVEFYFTQKKMPSFFGREVISSHMPCMKAHFELVAPQHLIFETKSYNNLPASKDTVLNEKRYLVIDDSKIPDYDEEKYSMYQANLKRVEYKLSYNKANNGATRLFTWNELAQKVYKIYTGTGEKENKRIRELFDITGATGTEMEKIVLLENYMKKNFIAKEDLPDDDADDLARVIKNKTASHKAICKLYAALFSQAGINFYIVLAGDRSDYTLDKNFENWNNTKNFLFYFPSTKKFLSPTEVEYRYPWFPPTWAATNGLFCISTTIGNFTTAVGDIKPIPMEEVRHSFSNMDMRLKFDKDEALIIDVKQTYGGYLAPSYRAPFVFLPADQQDQVLKELVKFGTNSENMLSHSLENKEMDQADPYKPFVISASVKTTNLVEKAGEKLIVKIGEVIGQQAELYNAKSRTTDMDVTVPHHLYRTIELTLPEGYKIKNPTDLNISEVYQEKDVETMGFVSSYTLTGNVLKITIKEEYNRVTYPKGQYENFKKVINASADFNKIVLILEKG
jgi:hypothetical protein